MKTGHPLIFFIAFALSISFSVCSKEKLPPFSNSGKNIFACYVNGKAWIAQGHTDFGTGLFVPAISGGFWPAGIRNKFHLYIVANRPDLTFAELYIKNDGVSDYLNEGAYLLNKKTISLQWASSADSNLVKDYGGYNYVTTDSSHHGRIEINKLDTLNKIVSGHFAFELPGLSITDGRFDVKN